MQSFSLDRVWSRYGLIRPYREATKASHPHMSAQKPLHYTDDQDEDVSLLSFREAGTQEDVTPLPSADDSIRNAMYIGLNIGSALCLTFLNKMCVMHRNARYVSADRNDQQCCRR